MYDMRRIVTETHCVPKAYTALKRLSMETSRLLGLPHPRSHFLPRPIFTSATILLAGDLGDTNCLLPNHAHIYYSFRLSPTPSWGTQHIGVSTAVPTKLPQDRWSKSWQCRSQSISLQCQIGENHAPDFDVFLRIEICQVMQWTCLYDFT